MKEKQDDTGERRADDSPDEPDSNVVYVPMRGVAR